MKVLKVRLFFVLLGILFLSSCSDIVLDEELENQPLDISYVNSYWSSKPFFAKDQELEDLYTLDIKNDIISLISLEKYARRLYNDKNMTIEKLIAQSRLDSENKINCQKFSVNSGYYHCSFNKGYGIATVANDIWPRIMFFDYIGFSEDTAHENNIDYTLDGRKIVVNKEQFLAYVEKEILPELEELKSRALRGESFTKEDISYKYNIVYLKKLTEEDLKNAVRQFIKEFEAKESKIKSEVKQEKQKRKDLKDLNGYHWINNSNNFTKFKIYKDHEYDEPYIYRVRINEINFETFAPLIAVLKPDEQKISMHNRHYNNECGYFYDLNTTLKLEYVGDDVWKATPIKEFDRCKKKQINNCRVGDCVEWYSYDELSFGDKKSSYLSKDLQKILRLMNAE